MATLIDRQSWLIRSGASSYSLQTFKCWKLPVSIRWHCDSAEDPPVKHVSTPSAGASRYLICHSSAKLAVAEALVRDGHGVRPVTEARRLVKLRSQKKRSKVYPGPSASVLAAARRFVVQVTAGQGRRGDTS